MQKLALSLLFLSIPSFAVVRIAATFPDESNTIFSPGKEMSCIATAVFKEAKKEGIDTSLKLMPNSRTAVSVLKVAKGIANENFDLAMGTVSSKEALTAARVLNPAKIPFIAPTASHPDLTKEKPYVFSLSFSDNHMAKILAKLSLNEFKAKRITIIRNASRPTSESIAQKYEEYLLRKAPKTKVHKFDIIEGYEKYDHLVRQILATEPELVFIPIHPLPAVEIYQRLAKAGQPLVLLGADSIGGRQQFIDRLGPKHPKIPFHFVKHWHENTRSQSAKSYHKLFKKHCSEHDHTMMTAATYDLANFVVETIKTKKRLKLASYTEALSRTTYSGVTGTLKFNNDRFVNKPVHIFSISQSGAQHWKSF